MKNAWLSLLVCFLVVLPPKVCTCAHSHEADGQDISRLLESHDELVASSGHDQSAGGTAEQNIPQPSSAPHSRHHHDPNCPCCCGAHDRDYLKTPTVIVMPVLEWHWLPSFTDEVTSRSTRTDLVTPRSGGPPLYLTLHVLLI